MERNRRLTPTSCAAPWTHPMRWVASDAGAQGSIIVEKRKDANVGYNAATDVLRRHVHANKCLEPMPSIVRRGHLARSVPHWTARRSDLPRVIVEIPQDEATAARSLMQLIGMPNAGRTKNIAAANAVRLTFVGYAFLDRWHQTNPATKEGHGHRKPGEVRTL